MTSYADPDLGGPPEDGMTADDRDPRLPKVQSSKRWRRWGKFAGGVAAAITAATTVWGILNTIGLQRDSNNLQRAAQNAHLEEMMMDVDRHFVRYPQLRPFFYDSKDYPSDQSKLRNQALATAEMIIDYADDIAAYVRVGKMDDRDHKRWSSMMWGYFRDSAVTRRQWKHFHSSYDRFTACMLGAPIGDELKHWHWKPRPKKPFDQKGC